jgi:hypothetical protein
MTLYEFIAPKFVQLFIKSKCDTADFIATLSKIISFSSLKHVTASIQEVLTKSIKIIENTDA